MADTEVSLPAGIEEQTPLGVPAPVSFPTTPQKPKSHGIKRTREDALLKSPDIVPPRKKMRLASPSPASDSDKENEGIPQNKINNEAPAQGLEEKTEKKTKKEQKPAIEPYKPFREELEKMLRKIPDRFLSRPAKPKPFVPLQKTVPQEFGFMKQSKSNKDKVTQRILEEQQAKVKPFKARPLNTKIFESAGELGVPRIRKRSLTKCEPFQFNVKEKKRAEKTEKQEEKPKATATKSKTNKSLRM